MEYRQSLISGLNAQGIPFKPHQIEQLLTYLDLLAKWNTRYNLVADSDKAAMVKRHLLDSLSIYKFVLAEQILDIGTGAGLPGIPLAILHPQKHFTLLDSNGKKTRFLFQVKTALELSNVTIENCRIEHYQCTHQIDMVTCRAFSSLAEIVSKSKHLMSRECKILAMKGKFPTQELDNLPEEFSVLNATELSVPGEAVARHLVEIGWK